METINSWTMIHKMWVVGWGLRAGRFAGNFLPTSCFWSLFLESSTYKQILLCLWGNDSVWKELPYVVKYFTSQEVTAAAWWAGLSIPKLISLFKIQSLRPSQKIRTQYAWNRVQHDWCVCVCVCVCARVRMCAQSCLTLCDPMDCSSPGSFVHGVLQERILKWIAISFSRESSWPSNQIRLSCISRDHIVHTVFKLFFFFNIPPMSFFLKIFFYFNFFHLFLLVGG